MTPVAAPSSAIDGPRPGRSPTDELVETLRDLIRIPSINPPSPDAPDGELARSLADRGRS